MLAVGVVGVVWTFFLSPYLFYFPLSGRRLDIDRNTVSESRQTETKTADQNCCYHVSIYMLGTFVSLGSVFIQRVLSCLLCQSAMIIPWFVHLYNEIIHEL